MAATVLSDAPIPDLDARSLNRDITIASMTSSPPVTKSTTSKVWIKISDQGNKTLRSCFADESLSVFLLEWPIGSKLLTDDGFRIKEDGVIMSEVGAFSPAKAPLFLIERP